MARGLTLGRWLLALPTLMWWPVQASVCSPAIHAEAASATVGRTASAEGSGLVDGLAVEESSLRVRLWRSAGGREGKARETVHLVHDYRAHDIDARINIPTNGHMHRMEAQWRLSSPHWEVGFAPVLAASSNAGRHPRVLDADLIDWQASARYVHAVSPNIALLFGACRDDRHGKRRIEPSAAIRWHSDRSEVLLGYPDTRLKLRINPALQATLSLSPTGGVWDAFNKELTRKSRLARRGWRLEAELGWKLGRHHQLTMATGVERRRSLEFEPEPGTRVRAAVADAPYLALRWRWLR